MEPPIKRFKYNDTIEDVLNLSITSSKPQFYIDVQNVDEMRQKFQQWVVEAYKDSSKTKTITRKKYERILKTLTGEIKNCAENSKFRFWMKCKGFKLKTQLDGNEMLTVQDKKASELKYKKVAMVENFFDIIYKAHVNEGARGIQHAGQKRTYRTITEIYAFLPREAVTKFLLFCCECQKRSYEERKCSPNSLSNDSINDYSLNTISLESDLINTPLDFSSRCNEMDELKVHRVWNDYDNNYLKSTLDDFCQSCNNRKPNRRRKRKFIRKIVRPPLVETQNFHFIDLKYENPEESTSPLNLVLKDIENTALSDTTKLINQPDILNLFNAKAFDETIKTHPQLKSSCCIENFPCIPRLSEILRDPVQFAQCSFSEQFYSSGNDDLIEQVAVSLIMRVRHLEEEKNSLTEDEKYQLSLKVQSCRISSFLLNYAADLILRSLILN